MNLLNIFKRKEKKKINIKSLPSRGFFYADDFEIYITKCSKDYIKEYKTGLNLTNISKLLKRITRLVIDHTTYSKGYSYKNITSIDLFYVFLEIAKFTSGKKIIIKHYDKENDTNVNIELNEDTFNYFQPSEKVMETYNEEEKCFDINGYMISSPTTGAEENLTELLNAVTPIPGSEIYNDYNYDFLYVLGGRTTLSIKEIKNLIQIFNNDITKEEKDRLKEAVSQLSPIQKYEVIYNNELLSVSSNINLRKIFN